MLLTPNQCFATEFFTMNSPATLAGVALLILNTDTIPHDLDAWLNAANGPANGPGTLLTAFTGASFTGVSGLNAKFGLSDTAPLVNRIWNSGGTSDNWSDANNWSSNHAPVTNDSLTFGSGARTTNYVNYPSLTVDSLTFTNSAPAFTIHVPESPGSRHLTINGPSIWSHIIFALAARLGRAP